MLRSCPFKAKLMRLLPLSPLGLHVGRVKLVNRESAVHSPLEFSTRFSSSIFPRCEANFAVWTRADEKELHPAWGEEDAVDVSSLYALPAPFPIAGDRFSFSPTVFFFSNQCPLVLKLSSRRGRRQRTMARIIIESDDFLFIFFFFSLLD
jgi:hypothetical protein